MNQIKIPNEDETSKVLNEKFLKLNIDIRRRINKWQEDETCNFIDVVDIQNINPTGDKLKGFGGICESPFIQIVNAVNALTKDSNNAENVANLANLCPTLLYFDDKCICFLPGGPRNTTVLRANSTSFTMGGANGATSHMHVLIIPRNPIYNAITLSPKHKDLITHMENIGRKVVCQLSVADNYYSDAKIQPPLLNLENWLQKMNEIENKALFEYNGYLPYGFNLYKKSAQALLGENGEDVKGFFQVHPDNSIGYLHMHMIPMKLVSKIGGETYFENGRNFFVPHVIKHLDKLTGGGKKRKQKNTKTLEKHTHIKLDRQIKYDGKKRNGYTSATGLTYYVKDINGKYKKIGKKDFTLC